MPNVRINQEFPPDQLSVTLYDPKTGQKIARWAEDEKRPENVLSGIKKSGRMNGGHTEMSGTLNRDPRESFPDLDPYTDLTLAGAGGTPVWEGRLDKAPEVDGQRMAIEPAAVGHSKALEDRGAVRVGFINSDLSAWGEPSARRQVEDPLTTDKFNNATTGVLPSGTEGTSAISHAWTRVTTKTGRDLAESWFGSSLELSGVMLEFIAKNLNANWHDRIYASPNDTASGATEIHDYLGASSGGLGYALPAGTRYLLLQDQYGLSLEEEGSWEAQWRNIKVLANTGLAVQGTFPEVGYTAKQILEYVVPRFSYLEVNSEYVETENFIIPHAWFGDPTPLATIVQELTKYELLRWFVLNGKRFELRKPGTFGRQWQASVGPSELQEAGNDGSRLWREIVVRWEDVSGKTLTAGPPGSGCDVESAALEITDPEHPAVKAGIPREDLLDLSGVSEEKFAVQVGERWLKEANEVSHSGQATLRGYCLESKGVFRPVSQVQPGDQIRFPDAGSGGTDYREIVQADYDHDSRTCQVTLDAPKESIQALLERYRAELKARANR